MNREIKFRIYSIDFGMQYPKKYLLSAFDFGVATEHYIDDSTSSYPITEKDIFLMQYTGLKDKNGKEIYEGDVIKYWWEEDANGEGGFNTKFGKVTVLFLDGCFLAGNLYLHDFISEDNNYQVIGNIYENPELL